MFPPRHMCGHLSSCFSAQIAHTMLTFGHVLYTWQCLCFSHLPQTTVPGQTLRHPCTGQPESPQLQAAVAKRKVVFSHSAPSVCLANAVLRVWNLRWTCGVVSESLPSNISLGKVCKRKFSRYTGQHQGRGLRETTLGRHNRPEQERGGCL